MTARVAGKDNPKVAAKAKAGRRLRPLAEATGLGTSFVSFTPDGPLLIQLRITPLPSFLFLRVLGRRSATALISKVEHICLRGSSKVWHPPSPPPD